MHLFLLLFIRIDHTFIEFFLRTIFSKIRQYFHYDKTFSNTFKICPYVNNTYQLNVHYRKLQEVCLLQVGLMARVQAKVLKVLGILEWLMDAETLQCNSLQ